MYPGTNTKATKGYIL